jgi:Domain of unknown function (DUF4129)
LVRDGVYADLTPKRRLLLLLTAITGAIVALAITVNSVALRPGQAWSDRELTKPTPTGEAPWINIVALLFRAFLIVALLALIVGLLSKNREPRRTPRRRYIIILVPLLWLLARRRQVRPPVGDATKVLKDTKKVVPVERVPPSRIDASRGVMTIAFAFALLLLIAAAWMIRSRRKSIGESAEDNIGKNAQSAADALRAGSNVSETIQRCYFEMCDVLEREEGIERASSMTPSEFESLLCARGLPRDAVHTLTTLFEETRYGGVQADSDRQRRGIASLEAIAVASRERVTSGVIPSLSGLANDGLANNGSTR